MSAFSVGSTGGFAGLPATAESEFGCGLASVRALCESRLARATAAGSKGLRDRRINRAGERGDFLGQEGDRGISTFTKSATDLDGVRLGEDLHLVLVRETETRVKLVRSRGRGPRSGPTG